MNDASYRRQLKVFEGYKTHMYRDSEGKVTLGVGIMFPSAKAAKSSKIGFVNRFTKKVATAEEIEADYELAKANKSTILDADENDLNRELEKRLKTAESDAKSYFKDFSKLPSPVQYALIDIAFNCGGGGLMNFKDLKKALDERNWEEAAKQSHRKKIQASRNKAISDWILSAGPTTKKIDTSKPREFFSSRFRKNHICEGNAPAKKRAEIVFQRRDKKISTVIWLTRSDLENLAGEVFQNQKEFGQSKKLNAITKGTYELWTRESSDKQATSTNAKFKYGVIRNTDGIYIMDHFDGF